MTRKISSERTYLYSKILPVIILLGALVLVFLLIFTNYKSNDLAPFIAIIVMFTLGWLIYFRKLEEVYLDKDCLIVKGNRIPFKRMLSLKKSQNSQYVVRYYQGDEIKSFKFLVSSVPFITPTYIKKMQALIEQNAH